MKNMNIDSTMTAEMIADIVRSKEDGDNVDVREDVKKCEKSVEIPHFWF